MVFAKKLLALLLCLFIASDPVMGEGWRTTLTPIIPNFSSREFRFKTEALTTEALSYPVRLLHLNTFPFLTHRFDFSQFMKEKADRNPWPVLDCLWVITPFLLHGGEWHDLGRGLAMAFVFRTLFSLGTLADENAHVQIASKRGLSEEAATPENRLGNHPPGEWLQGLIPFGPAIPSPFVSIPSLQSDSWGGTQTPADIAALDRSIRSAGPWGSLSAGILLSASLFGLSAIGLPQDILQAGLFASTLAFVSSVLSDWIAPRYLAECVIRGIYFCGCNFLIRLLPKRSGTEDIIEIRYPIVGQTSVPLTVIPQKTTMRVLMTEMIRTLDLRGRLQAGIRHFFKGTYVEAKINAPRRGPLAEALLDAYDAEEAQRKGLKEEEDGADRWMWHVRAPTAPSRDGTLNPIAAHPHQYLPDHREMVAHLVAGTPTTPFRTASRLVANSLVHNGDAKSLRIQCRLLTSSSSMYDVVDPLLGVISPTIKTGDTKVLAGLIDLFFTLGRARESARMAYHTQVVDERDEAGSVRSPPQDYFDMLGQFIETGIQHYARLTHFELPDSHRLPDVSQSQLRSLSEALIKQVTSPQERLAIPEWSLDDSESELTFSQDYLPAMHAIQVWPPEKRAAFITSCVNAYFKNDLYTSVNQMMRLVQGTFALVIETTEDSPENREVVVVSRTQKISIGMDWDKQLVGGSSSRQTMKWARYRLDLDNRGEIVGIRWDKDPSSGERRFTFRARKEGNDRDEPADELAQRWIDKHGNRYMSAPPPDNEPDLVGYEIDHIMTTLTQSRDSWRDSRIPSENRQTASEIVQVLRAILKQGGKGDFVFIGSEKSLESAKNAVETLKRFIPITELNVRYFSSNEVLAESDWPSNLRDVLGITPDTFAFVLSASGGDTFDTARVAELLPHMVKEMVIVSGLWDTEMAETAGQQFHNDSPFSRRLINTYGGWSLAEPATVTDIAMEFSLTQLLLRVFEDLANDPELERPFRMKLKAEDFKLLRIQITDYFLTHAARILGVQVDAQGRPSYDPYDHVIKVETPTHAKLVKDAAHFTQHSRELIAVAFILLPLIYAACVSFHVPLFPSSWSFPGLHHVSFIHGLLQNTWAPILLTVGGIIANFVFLIIFPFGITRLWRRVKGLQGGARRGPVTVVIADPAHKKLENLYSKTQSNLPNQMYPLFFGGDPADGLLHYYAHRVFRGTRIFLSYAYKGLRQLHRASTQMVESQASLIQHFGTGPEILVFDHEPYQIPIRVSFKELMDTLTQECGLSMDQQAVLEDYLEHLYDKAAGHSLWDLSSELGSQLGLSGNSLDHFKQHFDDYLDRQQAFDEFFKRRFSSAEIWLKHYVFAYQWAKGNAHSWYFRIVVFLLDHMPFRKRFLRKFPYLSFYIDIARTFVGTGRLTTASPVEGDHIAELIKSPMFPRLLRDTLRQPSAMLGHGIAVPSMIMRSPPSPEDDEDLETLTRRVMERRRQRMQASEPDERSTSSLIKNKRGSYGSQEVVLAATIARSGAYDEIMRGSHYAYGAVLEDILKEMRFEGIPFHDLMDLVIQVRRSSYRMVHEETKDRMRIWVVDEHILKDISAHKAGARNLLKLELRAAYYHSTEPPAMKDEDRARVEIKVAQKEIETDFQKLEPDEQDNIIEYLINGRLYDHPYDHAFGVVLNHFLDHGVGSSHYREGLINLVAAMLDDEMALRRRSPSVAEKEAVAPGPMRRPVPSSPLTDSPPISAPISARSSQRKSGERILLGILTTAIVLIAVYFGVRPLNTTGTKVPSKVPAAIQHPVPSQPVTLGPPISGVRPPTTPRSRLSLLVETPALKHLDRENPPVAQALRKAMRPIWNSIWRHPQEWPQSERPGNKFVRFTIDRSAFAQDPQVLYSTVADRTLAALAGTNFLGDRHPWQVTSQKDKLVKRLKRFNTYIGNDPAQTGWIYIQISNRRKSTQILKHSLLQASVRGFRESTTLGLASAAQTGHAVIQKLFPKAMAPSPRTVGTTQIPLQRKGTTLSRTIVPWTKLAFALFCIATAVMLIHQGSFTPELGFASSWKDVTVLLPTHEYVSMLQVHGHHLSWMGLASHVAAPLQRAGYVTSDPHYLSHLAHQLQHFNAVVMHNTYPDDAVVPIALQTKKDLIRHVVTGGGGHLLSRMGFPVLLILMGLLPLRKGPETSTRLRTAA